MTAIAVFCASRPVAAEFSELAAEVGRGIAAGGDSLVWGGGHVSMMGAVAEAARAGGARTLGVIPVSLVDREIADHGADELLVVDTMRERKQLMDDNAEAFLVLPGGVGTLEEFFEAWTAGYLSMHDKPVVVLDHDGFYAPLLNWIDDLKARGFVGDAALATLHRASTVADALDACRAGAASR
ncbi:TIGR00730 family Rossman fold protein [Tsukamurella serpentis]